MYSDVAVYKVFFSKLCYVFTLKWCNLVIQKLGH